MSNAPAPPTPLSPDAKLSSLTVSSGLLQPGFLPDTLNYTVDVLTSVASVNVAASPQNATATRTINGVATPVGQEELVPLEAPGSITTIRVVVTAQNNSQNTYIINVNRFGANNANLTGLTVTPGSWSPTFTTANTGPYSVDVTSSVNSVTVAATKSDSNATVYINGVLGTSLPITLPAAPSTTPVNVLVTAQDGVTTKTYVINVNRLGANNANLTGLTVTPGSWSPTFTTANTGPYSV
ncbi:MAG: cadherin-like beta sandwich domain-containing protein, partial [Nitrospiraceae bacterium]|nr:cadherin-like beta sandwich domain-containing protein [Nitrospiraceae bacterium]